jgi:hypothetical protein
VNTVNESPLKDEMQPSAEQIQAKDLSGPAVTERNEMKRRGNFKAMPRRVK